MQFHVPRFRKDRVEALERSLLVRISQNVLTCPTTACFNLLDTEPTISSWAASSPSSATAISSAARGSAGRCGSCRSWAASSSIDRRFGYRDGLMGGNLWFMGADVDAALLAAERAARRRGRRRRA